MESRVFANEGLLRVWIWCLLKASHKDTWAPMKTGKGSTEVEVPAGSFIFGRNTAAEELGMNPSTVYKRMKKLEDLGNINMQSNSHYSLVSICNWGSYQDSEYPKEQAKEQASNNQVTGREQPSNTYKNANNAKNVKNSKSVNSSAAHSLPDICEHADEAEEIAQHLLDAILHWDPTHKYHSNPPSIKSWILPIERLMRLDGKSKDQILRIINYTFTKGTKQAQFWAGNVWSGKKLREQYDKMKHDYLKELNQNSNNHTNGKSGQKNRADQFFERSEKILEGFQ